MTFSKLHQKANESVNSLWYHFENMDEPENVFSEFVDDTMVMLNYYTNYNNMEYRSYVNRFFMDYFNLCGEGIKHNRIIFLFEGVRYVVVQNGKSIFLEKK